MKNLRKVLSLILVVAMACSMMVFASAKDYKTFTDKADIGEQYVEAVDLISALGIFAGDETGALNPKGNFTRAQAAKIVTYMSIGASAAERLTPVGGYFTDVPASHWGSKYIAYAYEAGILGGDGDGKFRPDADVTGSEVAKLMNTVLGYGKMGEYTGKSWEINAISDGIYRGLITGDAQLSDPASRQEVIQYVFNTINPASARLTGEARNYYVEYSSIIGSYVISGSNFAETAKARFIGSEVFGLTAAFEEDASGHPVHTWMLGAKEITATYKDRAPDYSFTNGASIWDTSADMKSYDRETSSKLKFADGYWVTNASGGSTWQLYNVAVFYNGGRVPGTFNDAEDFMTNTFIDAYGASTTVNAVAGKGGVLTSIYLDNDGFVSRIVLIEKTFTEVLAAATYNAFGAISAIAGITSSSGDTFAGDTDVVKGEFVLYYEDADSVIHIERAEAVEGQLTKFTEGLFSLNAFAAVVFGGKTYSLSGLNGIRGYTSEGELETTIRVALTKTVNYNVDSVVYLDNNGSIVCITPGVGLEMNYVYLAQTGIDGFGSANQGRLVMTDGTYLVANIKAGVGTTILTSSTGWYTYSLKDGVYTLTTPSTTSHTRTTRVADATTSIVNGTPTIRLATDAGTPVSVTADNSTVFVIYNGTNFTTRVYKGISAVPTFVRNLAVANSGLADGDIISALKTSSTKTTVGYVFIQTQRAGAGASNVVFFGSVDASAWTELGDVDYVQYNSAYVNGAAEAKAIFLSKTGMPAEAGLKNVTISNDIYSVKGLYFGDTRYADDMDGITNGTAIVKPGNGVITFNGLGTYAVTSDAKLYEYENGALNVRTLNSIVTTASNGLDQAYKFWFVMNDKGVITQLYLQKDADATAAPKFTSTINAINAVYTYKPTADGFYSYIEVLNNETANPLTEATAPVYMKSLLSALVPAGSGVTIDKVELSSSASGVYSPAAATAYDSYYTVTLKWENVTITRYAKMINVTPPSADQVAVNDAAAALADTVTATVASVTTPVDISNQTAAVAAMKSQIEAYYATRLPVGSGIAVSAAFTAPVKADTSLTVTLTLTKGAATATKTVTITGMTFNTDTADAEAAAAAQIAAAEAVLDDAEVLEGINVAAAYNDATDTFVVTVSGTLDPADNVFSARARVLFDGVVNLTDGIPTAGKEKITYMAIDLNTVLEELGITVVAGDTYWLKQVNPAMNAAYGAGAFPGDTKESQPTGAQIAGGLFHFLIMEDGAKSATITLYDGDPAAAGTETLVTIVIDYNITIA